MRRFQHMMTCSLLATRDKYLCSYRSWRTRLWGSIGIELASGEHYMTTKLPLQGGEGGQLKTLTGIDAHYLLDQDLTDMTLTWGPEPNLCGIDLLWETVPTHFRLHKGKYHLTSHVFSRLQSSHSYLPPVVFNPPD